MAHIVVHELSLILKPTKRRRRERTSMALTVTKMTRIFQFSGIRLPDPNETMSVDEVKAFYAAQYPELATAVVNGPEAVGDKMRYTFDRAIGSKG
jgi:PRTRC genetic system protein C